MNPWQRKLREQRRSDQEVKSGRRKSRKSRVVQAEGSQLYSASV